MLNAADEEFAKYLKVNNFTDVINPYSIFGYNLVFWDDYSSVFVWREVNDVGLLTTPNLCYLYGPQKSLVTFVDIAFHLVEDSSFETALPRFVDRVSMFKALLSQNLPLYTASFTSPFPYEYRSAQSLLIHIVTGDYEDDYFKAVMLKTRINKLTA